MLMKDDSVFPEIFSAAFLGITGRQIDVIADRSYLLKKPQYRPHEWNAYPKLKLDSDEVYEVMLKGGMQKSRMEKRTFWSEEITA